MIRTRRLILRGARPADLADLHRLFSAPEAMRYWSHPAHTTVAETRQVLAGLCASSSLTGLEFVLERAGRVIGKAGMWQMGEIGYILHPDHWRQGLMSEALRAILPLAFARNPRLHVLIAEIDSRNAASARLLTGLGFTETHRVEKTHWLSGAWRDSTFWRLPRPSSG